MSSLSMPSASALHVVSEYLAVLEERADVSRAVRRQRGWALREAVLFAAARAQTDGSAGSLTAAERHALGGATARVRLGDLFAGGFAEQWLALADPLLRGAVTSSPATQRARITSLRALAVFAGAPVPAHLEPRPALRDVLTPPQVADALRALVSRLPGRGPDDHVRLAAVLAVMAARPVRSIELCGLRRDRIEDRADGVVLAIGADAVARIALHGLAAERMREWLAVRAALVSGLRGGPVHALWTSIRSNSRRDGAGDHGDDDPRGSLPLPPGMPLRPRGLQRAYARSVEAANLRYQGRPGFPLPRSLDLLRRSLETSLETSRPG